MRLFFPYSASTFQHREVQVFVENSPRKLEEGGTERRETYMSTGLPGFVQASMSSKLPEKLRDQKRAF
jgi:hypothetical protein